MLNMIAIVYRTAMSQPLIIEDYGTFGNGSFNDVERIRSVVLRRQSLNGINLRASMVITNNDTLSHLTDYMYHLLNINLECLISNSYKIKIATSTSTRSPSLITCSPTTWSALSMQRSTIRSCPHGAIRTRTLAIGTAWLENSSRTRRILEQPRSSWPTTERLRFSTFQCLRRLGQSSYFERPNFPIRITYFFCPSMTSFGCVCLRWFLRQRSFWRWPRLSSGKCLLHIM